LQEKIMTSDIDVKNPDTSAENNIEWHRLGELSQFPEGKISAATLPSGTAIAVYQVEGCFYVTFDRCTHGKASFVEEGELNGHTLECGWHHGRFDVRTGAATAMPCKTSLITYTTRIENDTLYINPKPNRRSR
jgi:nitrite reductase/ring-hydroxylating ferredoxin subunit